MLIKPDEISSTEKLLDLIRSGEGEESDPAGTPVFEQPKIRSRWSLSNLGRSVTVGVDIGLYNIRLVKVRAKNEFLDSAIIPFNPALRVTSPEFIQLLKTSLNKFIGRGKKVEIWCMLPVANTEIRYLKIPKVAKSDTANAVYWTFKRENPFNDAEYIFDYELLDDTDLSDINRQEVLAYIAPRKEVEDLKQLFIECGYELAGLTTATFALQNIFHNDLIESAGQNVANLFINQYSSRIDIYSNGILITSRGLKTGINSMLEAFNENLLEFQAESFGGLSFDFGDTEKTEPPARTEEVGLAYEKEFFDIISGKIPFMIFDQDRRIQEKDLFKMILPAVNRLIRRVETTLDHYIREVRDQKITGIFVSGQMSNYQTLYKYLSDQFGIPVTPIDPFVSLGVDLEPPAPTSISQFTNVNEALTPAFGLALSENDVTPNFLFTYQDKDEIKKYKIIKKIAYLTFMTVLALLIVVMIGQSYRSKQKSSELRQLQAKLDQSGPVIDAGIITRLVGKIGRNQKMLGEYATRYRSVAQLTELITKTPSYVRLLNVEFTLASTAEAKEPAVKEKKTKTRKREPAESSPKSLGNLLLEGVVLDQRSKLDSSLAQYLLGLQRSPLFGRPSLKKKTIETLGDQEVLVFTANLEII